MSSSANWSQIFRNSQELIRSGFLTTWNEQPLVVRTECNDLKWKFVLALVHAHTATILKMQPAQWGWGAGAGRAGLLALTVNRAVIFKHSKFSCKFFTGQFMAIICNAHHFPARAKRVLSADPVPPVQQDLGLYFCERMRTLKRSMFFVNDNDGSRGHEAFWIAAESDALCHNCMPPLGRTCLDMFGLSSLKGSAGSALAIPLLHPNLRQTKGRSSLANPQFKSWPGHRMHFRLLHIQNTSNKRTWSPTNHSEIHRN